MAAARAAPEVRKLAQCVQLLSASRAAYIIRQLACGRSPLVDAARPVKPLIRRRSRPVSPPGGAAHKESRPRRRRLLGKAVRPASEKACSARRPALRGSLHNRVLRKPTCLQRQPLSSGSQAAEAGSQLAKAACLPVKALHP